MFSEEHETTNDVHANKVRRKPEHDKTDDIPINITFTKPTIRDKISVVSNYSSI